MFHHPLVLALLVAAAGPALARNDRLLLPIEPALRSTALRQVVAPDIALRFGAATGDANTPVVEAHAVADPWSASNNNAGGTRSRRSDADTCRDAFGKALAQLQQRARMQGANVVAGIVSYYNRFEMDSREMYECHAGNTRAVVDLKGRLAAGTQPVVAPPLPAASAAPARIASGYAALEDIDAVPYLDDRGRDGYRQYIGRPTPKAFAIAPNGRWFSAWTLNPGEAGMPTDPTERAVVACERAAKMPCRLYAVNGSVVWTKEPR